MGISILVKNFENLDFGEKLRYSRVWTFSKNPVFIRNPRQISIFVKIYENFAFGHNFEKSRFWSQFSKNLDFGQNFRKISILVKNFVTV